MYILIFNPVSGKAYYLVTVKGAMFRQGAVKMLAKMIWSNNDEYETGIHRAYTLLEKWYNIHIKLMKAVFGTRWLAERYAPHYILEAGVPTPSATVDLDETSLTVFWGDLTRDKENKHHLYLVTLFKDAERLQKFLNQESVFVESLIEAHTEYKSQITRFADAYTNIITIANQILQEIIDKLPGSYEIIENVLQKYNVTGKDIIEYATEEATAKLIIAKLQEQLAQTQPPPAQAKAVTETKP
jgi:hypothetical protein